MCVGMSGRESRYKKNVSGILRVCVEGRVCARVCVRDLESMSMCVCLCEWRRE